VSVSRLGCFGEQEEEGVTEDSSGIVAVRGKVTLVHTSLQHEDRWRSGGKAPLILNLGNSWR
jgi:hypothetical protein